MSDSGALASVLIIRSDEALAIAPRAQTGALAVPLRAEISSPATRSAGRLSRSDTIQSRLAGLVPPPELRAIVLFCAIGFLAAICLIEAFPNLGALMAGTLEQIP